MMATKEVSDYQLTAGELSAADRRKAVLAVASAAVGPAECDLFLDMLGLDAAEAFPEVPAPRR